MTETLERTTFLRPPRGARTVGSAPAIEWVASVLRAKPGALPVDFAASADVTRKTVESLLGSSPRPSLRWDTYERIMNTGPEDVKIAPGRIVSGRPALRIVQELRDDGWNLPEIAGAAGLKPATLRATNLGRVRVETLSRIVLAKRLLDVRRTRGGVNSSAHVPAYPTTRRIEALMVQGWTRDEIAQRAGLSAGVIQNRSARKHVTVATAERVRKAFASMRIMSGDSVVTMKTAKRLGYAPWSAWSDGSMDVGSAVPDYGFVDDPQWGGRHSAALGSIMFGRL